MRRKISSPKQVTSFGIIRRIWHRLYKQGCPDFLRACPSVGLDEYIDMTHTAADVKY
jgi:hypothetical protein